MHRLSIGFAAFLCLPAFAHIHSLQPAETTAGAAGFTLRVLGAEFEFNEFVKWNGTPLATTFINSEELRAIVPASLLTTPGPVTVSLSSGGTPSGYGYEYNTPSGNSARFTIHPPPAITTVSPLPAGSTSAAYTRALAASGGTMPFRWSIVSGALPGGVALDAATGVLSGTPRAEGSFRFTVRLTDRASVEASKEFLLVIGQGPVQGAAPSCAVTPQNLLLSMHHPSAHVPGGVFPLAPDHIVRVAVTAANGAIAAGVSVQMSSTRGVFANGSSTATSVTGADGIAKFVVNPPAPQGFDRADLTATFVVSGKPHQCAGSVLTGVGLLSAMRERLSGTVQTALSRLRRQYDVDYRRFGDEARAMLERDHDLAAEAMVAVERYEPKLQRVLAGEEVRLRAGELEKLEKVLDRMKQRATPQFRAAMTEWMQELYRAQPKVRYEPASIWKAPAFAVGRPPAPATDGRKNVRLNFEVNAGQAGPGRREVRYLARGAVHQAMFTEEGTVILRTPMTDPVRVRFGKGKPELLEPTGSMTHYLAGNDPGAWRTGIPHHARLRYRGVFPGTDLVFYGDEGQLRYDFILRPGANPNKIAVTFEGIRGVEPSSNGELILHTDGGVLRLGVPYVYQLDDNGRPQAIAARYRSRGSRNRIGFELAKYDPAKPLVIDPVIQYASFAGGLGDDAGLAVKADAQGSAYVAGFSGTTDVQAFVTKFSADGSRILYTTYFGGSGVDIATGLALDAQGNVYVCGSTSSPDFPVANGFRMTYSGGPGDLMADGFVVKIDSSGSRIVHGSFVGGSGADAATAIAADAAGNAYVTGYTGSLDFPVRNGVQASNRGGTYMKSDGFVLKVSAAGNALEYSSYLGGSGDDTGLAIALDAAGNAYLAGTSHSEDFPVTAGAYQTSRRSETDGFVTKLNPAGNVLLYSTYLGGSSDDSVAAIAVDAAGAAYVAGVTGSSNFPVLPASNAAQVKPGSTDGLGFDAFAAKLAPAGNALVYATFLGGSGTEMAHGIAVDATGAAYVVGETGSADYPVTNPLRLAGSGTDSFVTKLNASGTAMEYSSYLGGQSLDSAAAVALDAAGNVYVAGSTASPDHAVTAGAAGARLAGRSDAFAIKITPEGTTPPLAEARSAASFARGTAVAADSVVSILGSGFVNGEEYAEYPREELRGLRVEITDGQGATRNAPLYLASASRIDVVVPADVAPGSVSALRVQQGSSVVAAGSMLVQKVAPGIFTENGRGSGPPRGWAVRVDGDGGAETVLPLGQCGSGNPECEALELDMGPAGARLTLTLLATGVRHGGTLEMMAGGEVGIPVLEATAHPDFPGYDQIVVGPLPEALRGRGVVEMVLIVDGERANPVRIRVK